MNENIFKCRVDDIKFGYDGGTCSKCKETVESLIRLTFIPSKTLTPELVDTKWYDKFVCTGCAEQITRGMKFNLFSQQI